jgi:NAD(P)-dependent dehydrogenase (short-subunit alcohol dehydrogenase family)
MSKTLIDASLERTVVPSFSRLGIRIRRRLFAWQTLEDGSLKGRVVVISGATSGIGEAGAYQLARLGATLVIIARDQHKCEQLIASLMKDTGNQDIHQVIADLGSQAQTREAAAQIASRWPAIDVLIHNAGALFNERRRADNGTDLSVELMVSTPFLLTGLLLVPLAAATDATLAAQRQVSPAPSRVITMSSGGMYTEALDVERLQMSDENYHGAKQYARAKRAQVILNELWAHKVASASTVFHALHPGWVNTPGINDALPGFSKLLNPLGLLRTADEGADTMVWLCVDQKVARTSGLFWHDRQVRKIDMSAKTRQADTPEQRRKLWHWCEAQTQWSMPEV